MRVLRAADVSDLELLCRWTEVSAVLVHVPTVRMHWMQALHQVKTLAPHAHVVICHGVREANAIFDMTDAGAFHTLLVPLEQGEVRQSLGFISAAVAVAA
jgi:DNA-binding NtrC family response regulator